MPDQFLKCEDCQEEFIHTERDQEFYKEREFSLPKRCRPCRQKKKARFSRDGDSQDDRTY